MKQKKVFIEQNNRRNSFYENIMNLFNLKSIMQNNLLYILNKNLKNDYLCTYDNKQMIRIDDRSKVPNEEDEGLMIPFHPLINIKESCSHLLIDDSVHLYLRNLTFHIFRKIITTQDGTITKSPYNMFDTDQLNDLLKPNKNTKYKFYNLFNIVSATSFSKNLISFEIDFTNSPQNVKVNFKYPLYDMLSTTQNNTIFGIHLETDEIKLFKQIYENYIINIINNLFQEPIKIPKQSNQYPKFYILATIKLMLEETYWKQYNIYFIFSFKDKIKRYKDMLSNLNQYKQYNEFTFLEYIYTKRAQEIDQEAYKNEIQIRQASEPNWLLLKGDKMVNGKQQPAVIKNNNIVQTIDKFGRLIEYDTKQYQNKIRKFTAEILAQEYKNNYQIWKNNQEWNDIFYWQNLVLDILRNNGGGLWYDTRIKKYCFRSKFNASPINVDSTELGDLLTRALKEKITAYLNRNHRTFFSDYAIEIVLVSKLKSLNKQKLNINEKADNAIKILLFEDAIFTIDDDAFNIHNDEFFKHNHTDLFFTRNRFVSNQYLEKRYEQNQSTLPNNIEQAFIEKFIYYLVREDQELSDYIMNWLAYYFQNLQRSKTALVLLGEQEVTKDIFWNIIIKEIFSKQYSTTIDDKECDTTLVSDIATDKLFFHIDDIVDADTKFDDQTLALIIKDLLIKPSVTTDTNEEIYIHGQMIITAKNTAPYLKKVLSKCTVIEVNDIDTILEKLEVEDEAELEDMIQNDLHNFTDKLLQYNVIIDKALKNIDTEARQTLKSNKSSNVNPEDIDNNIDTFIQAIKNKDIDYFAKVENIDDGTIYKHLKNAFNKDEGYFINQYLFDCYNSIYANQPFKKKTHFTGKLKEKDDMFKQEVKILKILNKDSNEEVLFQPCKTSQETGNKELCRIKDYVLARDIVISTGATILSSQENITKFTFENDEDIDNCINRTKEYRASKDREKKEI